MQNQDQKIKFCLDDDSKSKLMTCHPRLVDVVETASKYLPLRVIHGRRSNELQDELYAQGKTKLRGGQSKHNKNPSDAVDVVILPVDWHDTLRFYFVAGFIMGIAAEKGVRLIWGGNWKKDFDFKSNKFNDLVHFEMDRSAPSA